MLRFRPQAGTALPGAVGDLLAVSQVIDDAMRPGNFFVAADLRLHWVAAQSATIRWEVFRGRLVEAAHTREEKTFLSWHVREEDATEPTISVKLDVHGRTIHVTRGLLCYAHEAYDAGGGVIESREVEKWTRELVGTIHLADFADLEPLRDELICQIWHAIVGTSRLPLTSVEAPLPAFSFGRLHYLFEHEASAKAITSWEDWLTRGLQAPSAWREAVKLVEFALRSMQGKAADIERLTQRLASRSAGEETSTRVLQSLFNEVSLSPATGFAERVLAWGVNSSAKALTFLGDLLLQLCRHLTAYDLVTFHHRGANYPDALLLDAALRHFLTALNEPTLAAESAARRQRRALRQAIGMRRRYEGHLVPDLPTSPGENARVLPASHPRIAEEQLTQTMRRRRQLFAGAPLAGLLDESARAVLAQSVRDLDYLDERVEMGLGLFIDRPLGYEKAIGEPDLTPMLAHEVFSPSIARRRWGELKKLCAELGIPCDAAKLDPLFENGPWPEGLPHSEVAECPRPVAALGDVRKVADDFVILRTKPVGLARMLEPYRLLESLSAQFRMPSFQDTRLCVPSRDAVTLHDDQLRRRVEIRVDVSKGYGCRAGVEYPRAGLRVTAVWEDTDAPGELVRRETDWRFFV